MQTKKLIEYTLAIHNEICACDDKRCEYYQDIEDWLQMGYLKDNPTIETLINEYRELLEQANE